MRYYFFIVEGAHDVETVGRIFKRLGMKEQTKSEDVDEVWKMLIPTSYPFEEKRLDRIVPVPSFYESDEISIAIKVADGDTKIISALNTAVGNMPRESLKKIDGIAVVFDADTEDAKGRYENFIKKIKEAIEEPKINKTDIWFDENFFINKIGKIKNIEIKSAIYVFPDNAGKGTLEDILLECARIKYPDLLSAANEYVDKVNEEYKKQSKWSVSSKNKVIVGCIANVFRPGKANQISIRDNFWISEDTISACTNLNKLYDFVVDFIGK